MFYAELSKFSYLSYLELCPQIRLPLFALTLLRLETHFGDIYASSEDPVQMNLTQQ